MGGFEGLVDLFLFHQFRIRAIINDIFAKDRSCERTVYFLRIKILVFAIQDELIAFDSQADSRLLPEQDKCKNITILDAALALALTVT